MNELAHNMHDAEMDRLRVPPHSVEAEQAVLGGLMLDNRAWDTIADIITDGDFYRTDHRHIFGAIQHLADTGQPYDPVTISELLNNKDKLSQAGGLDYLGELARETPSAANIRAYAEIVRERAMLRDLIRVGGEIASSAHNTGGSAATVLVDEAERRVLEIAERGKRRGSGFVPIRHILSPTIDRLDTLHNTPGDLTGVSSGYKELDRMTAGLQPGDLIIVAGRPSMGKTSLAMNIAENAALGKSPVPAAIFSMEMSSDQVALRMISSLGQLDQSKLRTGRFRDEDWPTITGVIAQMSEAPIFIDDTPALSPTEVRARARRLKREHGLGLIVLDYIQLMGIGGSVENRATEISEISRGLKALARELEVPVIALSQLNRSVEQRTDKRPVMSDLRESGAIEQDADLILFIYRDEVYDKESARKGIADIIIAKQRNGPIGDFPLTFRGQYTRFDDFVPDSYGESPF